jgi:hypothetical protein
MARNLDEIRTISGGEEIALAVNKFPMARIRTTHSAKGTVVTITGRLTASDMGRLEQACAPALIARALRLELDLRAVTFTDATASTLLQRMAERGALVTTASGYDAIEA